MLKKALYSILFILIPFFSFSQSGTLKTKTGFLLYFNDKPISFTVRLDEPNSEIPYWEDSNVICLFKNKMYLTIIDEQSILCQIGSPSEKLICYQNWETDYIDKTINKNTERTGFLNDNTNLNLPKKNCETNAWYYLVKANSDYLCFYSLDIYSNTGLIRIIYRGDIRNARIFTNAVFSGMRFFDKEIDIKKLQYKLKNGDNDF